MTKNRQIFFINKPKLLEIFFLKMGWEMLNIFPFLSYVGKSKSCQPWDSEIDFGGAKH